MPLELLRLETLDSVATHVRDLDRPRVWTAVVDGVASAMLGGVVASERELAA